MRTHREPERLGQTPPGASAPRCRATRRGRRCAGTSRLRRRASPPGRFAGRSARVGLSRLRSPGTVFEMATVFVDMALGAAELAGLDIGHAGVVGFVVRVRIPATQLLKELSPPKIARAPAHSSTP